MGTIVRYEFLGSRLYFWFLCFTVLGIPLAVLYLVDTTVRVEERLENPTAFLEAFRSGSVSRR